MKHLLLATLFLCQSAFAAELLLRGSELSVQDDKVTLIRDSQSPKEFFLTLKTNFVNRNVNLGCEETRDVERTGPHASCPPVVRQVESCSKQQSAETVMREACTITAGQDCKMEISKRWTECKLLDQSSMGSCNYTERVCVRYTHPTQERLVSILVKFHRSADISGKDKEKLHVSLKIMPDGKTPAWEIKFLEAAEDYKIEKKEGNRIFSKDPYYLISK